METYEQPFYIFLATLPAPVELLPSHRFWTLRRRAVIPGSEPGSAEFYHPPNLGDWIGLRGKINRKP